MIGGNSMKAEWLGYGSSHPLCGTHVRRMERLVVCEHVEKTRKILNRGCNAP
jgi:hypothetical protein